jgi:L-2-hydroxyglutarate oxidase
MRYDYCVIGGGIVGLATAMALLARQPGASLVLLEKEDALARHQTGRNSGVIHAGIYYAPGSLKATLCREGNIATKAFCDEAGIPYETCGKLVVATNALELQRLAGLEERAADNGIAARRLGEAELHDLEPEVAGLGALLVPSTGIVDYKRVAEAMADRVRKAGGELRLGAAVTHIRETGDAVEVVTGDGTVWQASRLIACAGLQADRIARLAGLAADFRIVPFRGEYYALPPSWFAKVRHLIYPVPNPELPFLGIHLTRMIDGRITVGPNAVLGFGRERYARFSIAPRDVADYASFPGFWRVLRLHWRSALTEMHRSLSSTQFLAECRKYAPSLALGDLLPSPAGIRAQAVQRDGTFVHDFLMLQTTRMLHVCNAPSPAATSAIPIGRMIARRVQT